MVTSTWCKNLWQRSLPSLLRCARFVGISLVVVCFYSVLLVSVIHQVGKGADTFLKVKAPIAKAATQTVATTTSQDETTLKNILLKDNIFHLTWINDKTKAPAFTYACSYNLLFGVKQQGTQSLNCAQTVLSNLLYKALVDEDYTLKQDSPTCGALPCNATSPVANMANVSGQISAYQPYAESATNRQ